MALTLLAAAMLAACGAMSASDAMAERSIVIGQAKRTATVSVYIGKTEDVRTDTSFVELQVGDPEVADVNPLTDRLAVHSRPEERHDARVGLCRRQEADRRVRRRGGLRHLAGQHRDPAPLSERQASE